LFPAISERGMTEKPAQPFIPRWMAKIRSSYTPSQVIILALDFELNGSEQIPMP
jgi:hypothetical protein